MYQGVPLVSVRCHSLWWSRVWCLLQSRAALSRLVWPPWCQGVMWWASHQVAGAVQSGCAAQVAGVEEFALGGGEEALGASGVDDGLPGAVGEPGDLGIAQGFLKQVQGHGSAVGGVGGAAVVRSVQVCFAAADDELGFQASVDGQGPGAGGQLHAGQQPVEDFLSVGAGVLGGRVGGIQSGHGLFTARGRYPGSWSSFRFWSGPVCGSGAGCGAGPAASSWVAVRDGPRTQGEGGRGAGGSSSQMLKSPREGRHPQVLRACLWRAWLCRDLLPGMARPRAAAHRTGGPASTTVSIVITVIIVGVLAIATRARGRIIRATRSWAVALAAGAVASDRSLVVLVAAAALVLTVDVATAAVVVRRCRGSGWW